MIYEHYFALTQRPFSIAPNPNFLYACGQYKEALAALEYGMLHRGGFVLLTGEVGTGKTTLCKFLLQSVPQDTELALVLHPQLDRIELLQLICKEFGLETKVDAKESDLIESLTEFLLTVYSKGGYSVLIIDEAQHLDESVLELVRLLTNLETHEDKLLQIILLGQPELKARLNQYQLRQLNQRFTARFHLKSLSFLQTKSYLNHRIEVAGGHESLFSVPAAWLLYRLTKGVPRLMNVLADRCLMGCYAEQKKQVTAFMVWRAAKEVLPSAEKKKVSGRWLLAFSFLFAIVFGFNELRTQSSKPVFENLAQNSFVAEIVNQMQPEQNTNLVVSACQENKQCWIGLLPVSVLSGASVDGDVLVAGQWQSLAGQVLKGEQARVLLNNVDQRYLNGLIKPYEEDPLIPWVREILLSQSHGSAGDDFSQWQMITPSSISNHTSLSYDVVLHEMVTSFQKKHGLIVDGVLGPQTLISLSLWHRKTEMAAQ